MALVHDPELMLPRMPVCDRCQLGMKKINIAIPPKDKLHEKVKGIKIYYTDPTKARCQCINPEIITLYLWCDGVRWRRDGPCQCCKSITEQMRTFNVVEKKNPFIKRNNMYGIRYYYWYLQ